MRWPLAGMHVALCYYREFWSRVGEDSDKPKDYGTDGKHGEILKSSHRHHFDQWLLDVRDGGELPIDPIFLLFLTLAHSWRSLIKYGAQI